jgi:AcrR family transcriptional regulator
MRMPVAIAGRQYITIRHGMLAEPAVPLEPAEPVGRPRDRRIDAAVLRATVDLLEEVGYARLSIAAVAARAGTTKPAVYRRWPSKARLVHEAVFPCEDATLAPASDDLAADLAAMVRGAVELFARPAVRAALPGLLAEFAADPELHAQLQARLSDQVWGAMRRRVAEATARGAVRPGVDASAVLELVAGGALVALLVRPPGELDEDWVRSTVEVLTKGIAA